MTTATLRNRMAETLARLDKACGKSFIAENQKCTKDVVGRSPKAEPSSDKQKSNLTRNLATAGGIAMVGGVLVGLNLAKDVLNSELPASAKCPPKPPKGLYDSFTPGDLIYTSYDMDGILRAHYGVYMGKDADGNHTLVHTTAKEEDGKIIASHINKMTLDEAAKDGSFRKAGRTKQAGVRPSTEQLHKLADELNGRNYDWDGFENNCETFARALVNDLPISLQGQKVSKFNRILVSAIVKGTVGKDWDRENVLTPKEVTERVKELANSDSFRTDKACGKSFIAENQKCTKPVAQQHKALNNSAIFKAAALGAGAGFVGSMIASYGPSIFRGKDALPDDARDKMTNALKTAAGVAVVGGVLAVLGRSTYEVLNANLPEDSLPPKVPPKGYYDTLRPGDILYKGIDLAGGQKAHYAVYYGKENGVHKIVDVRRGIDDDTLNEMTAINAKIRALPVPKTPEEVVKYNKAYDKLAAQHVEADKKQRSQSRIDINDLDEAVGAKQTSYAKAERLDSSRPSPTTEQLHKIVSQMEGKSFDWTGFENNCETFSRALVNDLPISTQAKGVSKLTADMTHALMSVSVLPKSRRGYMTTKSVNEVATKTIRGDAMNPKAQAERILTPIFNNRPLTVMSVSLSPEGNPVGVFRGEPRPGQTHYYTFKMGQNVTFKRVMVKKDAMDEGCGCEACDKKKKRPKGEAFEKVDALLERLDKKCGASGIPDNAKCTKGEGQSSVAIHAAFMKRARASGNPEAMMNRQEGQAYVKAKIREHYKKRAIQKRKAKRIKGSLARLALSAAAGGAVGLAGLAAIEAAKRTRAGSLAKADALLERLDKKCGASGIPDNAKCTKGEGSATKEFMTPAEAEAHVKGKIETHYKKQSEKKTAKKAVRNRLLALGGLVAANVALRVVANRSVEKQVMKQHGVDRATAKKFREDVAKAYSKGGAAGADAFYRAWQRENDPKAAGASTQKAGAIERNWNKTLDVPPDATPAQVKAAFRKKAKETHPDHGGSAEEFAKVQKAWESAQALGKVKRGDSIEMEWFIKRMDAEFAMA